jgi:hypothetical protein
LQGDHIKPDQAGSNKMLKRHDWIFKTSIYLSFGKLHRAMDRRELWLLNFIPLFAIRAQPSGPAADRGSRANEVISSEIFMIKVPPSGFMVSPDPMGPSARPAIMI